LVQAPFDEELQPEQRTQTAIMLSELIIKIATHIICHTLVDNQEQLKEERVSIALAFLQRVTTTHMCNHKLTAEGIVYEFNGQSFQLHEEYKATTLTRSAYEHLVMFYFLYEHPKTPAERDMVWKYWQLCSKNSLLDYHAAGDADGQRQLQEEIETLRNEMLSTPIGRQCYHKLDEWTKIGTHPSNGSIEFFVNNGNYDVRRVSYSQAWRYLFANEDMMLLYRHLSLHSHPVYNGLLQYQYQSLNDQGDDGIPLHISSSILAYLCQLFLKLVPHGDDMIKQSFSLHEQRILRAMARL